VELSDDGSFTADASAVLSDEQYLGAGLMSDEQNRRGRVLAALLADSTKRNYPLRPTLLLWTDPWPLGLLFDERMRREGAALVAAPISFERPPPKTEVTIPPPLLPYRETVGPDGAVPVGLYDYRHHEWQEKSQATSVWLRFQVPQELLPLTPQSAKLVVRVTGPVGQFEIAAHQNGQAVPVKAWTRPVGTLTAEITDPDHLAIDADGGLLLRVAAGDPNRPTSSTNGSGDGHRSYWRIESLSLELRAKISQSAK
jgi:hypothetical protein